MPEKDNSTPLDPAHEYTDEEIARIEKRLRREYAQAARDADLKCRKFLEKFEKKDDEMRRQMSYGLIDEDEYQEWRRRQILQMDHYQQMVDVIASDYAHANEQARQIIAGEQPAIYAENFNFATWEAEEYGRINTSFTLYNRGAVAELALHDADLLPLPSAKRLAELKAKDMLWNRQLVSSSIMQSIISGESVPKMAKRLAVSVGEKNYNSAVRAARTMSTAVQNKARTDAYVRAKKEGSKIQMQVWLATLDGRTRHAHRQLDHQEVPVGEPFKVDGYELMFPADPAAPAYLKYNCRCRVRGKIEGLEMLSGKNPDYHKLGGQSYEEWKADKAKTESWKTIEKNQRKAQYAKTEDEAVELLNKNGFKLEKAPDGMDPKLLKKNANQLFELNSIYGMNGGDHGAINFRMGNVENGMAEVTGDIFEKKLKSINFDKRYYSVQQALRISVWNGRESGLYMPCDDAHLSIYPVTHEYGHILQTNMILEEMRKVKLETRTELETFFRSVSSRHKDEIIAIAKEKDANFDVNSYISGAGKANPEEFFAECFANAHCGNPNELGKATKKWLRRNGYDV